MLLGMKMSNYTDFFVDRLNVEHSLVIYGVVWQGQAEHQLSSNKMQTPVNSVFLLSQTDWVHRINLVPSAGALPTNIKWQSVQSQQHSVLQFPDIIQRVDDGYEHRLAMAEAPEQLKVLNLSLNSKYHGPINCLRSMVAYASGGPPSKNSGNITHLNSL